MTASPNNPTSFKGNDSALLGIVLAVVTFWLFAQTTMNIGALIAVLVIVPGRIATPHSSRNNPTRSSIRDTNAGCAGCSCVDAAPQAGGVG